MSSAPETPEDILKVNQQAAQSTTLSFQPSRSVPVGGRAIVAFHGMGTHLSGSGITDVVQILQKEKELVSTRIRTTTESVGGDPCVVTRAECELTHGRRVDVFEVNYSDVPKGKSGIADVLTFLLQAGWTGIKGNRWTRWTFDKAQEVAEGKAPTSNNHLNLVIAFLTIVGVIGLNALFLGHVLVGDAIRYPQPPARILTLLLTALLALGGLEGLLISRASKAPRNGRPSPSAYLAWGGFFVLLLAVMAATIVGATTAAGLPISPPDWLELAGAGLLRFVAAVGIGWLLAQFLTAEPKSRVVWQIIWTALVGSGLGWSLVNYPESRSIDVALAGGLFLIASAGFRMFLLEYAGDVCCYVGGNQASKFATTREAVRARADQVMDYLAEQGYRVTVFAHSLGTVVAYDAVNRALIKHRSEDGTLMVDQMLTFGCPLDKIAYLFDTVDAASANPVRQAYVAARQPLVGDQATREKFAWVNVYHEWDIVSGDISHYGPERAGKVIDIPTHFATPQLAILNIKDEDNFTPLVNHSVYNSFATVPKSLVALLKL